MSVAGVFLDDSVEVFNGLFVVLDHLVRLCALMNVSDVVWHTVNALGEGEDGLFKFLQSAIAEPNVVVDVWLITWERSVACLKTVLEGHVTFLVLFKSVVG